jgi:hypothetical protein
MKAEPNSNGLRFDSSPVRAHAGTLAAPKCCWNEMRNSRYALTND